MFTNPKTGNPKFLVTYMYGIVYILLGNVSGNAIAFGSCVMTAAGQADPARGTVIGIAIAATSTAILLHICSRRAGIVIRNTFAVMKVLLLVAIVLGFLKAGGLRLGGAPKSTQNFNADTVFYSTHHDVGSYSDSLLYIFNSYSGFKQPFLRPERSPQAAESLLPYTLIAMFLPLSSSL